MGGADARASGRKRTRKAYDREDSLVSALCVSWRLRLVSNDKGRATNHVKVVYHTSCTQYPRHAVVRLAFRPERRKSGVQATTPPMPVSTVRLPAVQCGRCCALAGSTINRQDCRTATVRACRQRIATSAPAARAGPSMRRLTAQWKLAAGFLLNKLRYRRFTTPSQWVYAHGTAAEFRSCGCLCRTCEQAVSE